ncbi:MAG: hypothetical protein IJG00_00490 [Clostridia bacterium]|nr:hypothetical protein [Clostridia bacterium]
MSLFRIESSKRKAKEKKPKTLSGSHSKLRLNNFAAAKNKFGTDEEAENYFILVELYEKHLTGKQKEIFLKADSIDSMLNVLNKNQLKHLRSLLSASLVGQSARSHNDPEFKKEAFSKWYIKNMSGKKINILKLSARIYDKQIEKTKVQDLVSKFNSRLKNFDGDIKEYCQWLILLSVDNSIPSIESVYDVHKLLKPLDLTRLKKLLWELTKSHNTTSIVEDMERLEPYFYKLATEKLKYSSQPELDILFNEAERTFIEENPSSVTKMFDKERKNLIDTIENLIKEKRSILKSTVAKLGSSKTFEDSLTKVADLVGGDDEIFVKEAIGEYSMLGANGSTFNTFLRKAKFFEKLSKEKNFSSDEIKTFRKRMAQASKYFEDHLTKKEYTTYRGMRSDGLKALLDKSTPKIHYKTGKNHELIVDDDLIKEINKCKPIVFDEGITSVSLNKGVAGHPYFFRGKTPGNVFLTIKIPPNSKALVLDYEGIQNAPGEEELLIAPKTKIKINSIREVDKHYEIVAQVLN